MATVFQLLWVLGLVPYPLSTFVLTFPTQKVRKELTRHTSREFVNSQIVGLVSKSTPKPGRNLGFPGGDSGAVTWLVGDSGAPWWSLVAPGVSPLVVALGGSS